MRLAGALLWLWVLVCPLVLAATPIGEPAPVATLTDPTQVWNLGRGVHHLPGAAAEHFDEVRGLPLEQWSSSEKNSLNLGSRKDGVWLRFDVRNQSASQIQWLLKFTWPLLDRVELRLYHAATGTWGAPMLGGDALPVSVRPIAE